MTAQEALHTYFGYDAFRPMQAEIIDSVLAGNDTLALLPSTVTETGIDPLPVSAGTTIVCPPPDELLLPEPPFPPAPPLGGIIHTPSSISFSP
jgi:hypothetical protein